MNKIIALALSAIYVFFMDVRNSIAAKNQGQIGPSKVSFEKPKQTPGSGRVFYTNRCELHKDIENEKNQA